MKNKKVIISIVALAALIALMLGIYFANRPQTSTAEKSITVVIVHSDGTEKTVTWRTEAECLADALLEKELVTGYTGEYGLTIEAADGETADWTTDGAYWAIYIGEEYATEGASDLALEDGGVYRLVYEKF